MQLTIARDMDSLQEALALLARHGKRVGLVPTMGALHDGHLSLIRRAQEEADAAVVSIFVNPKQFGPNEDFSKYPRMVEADIRKAEEAGAAVVYAPPPEDLYPEGFSTAVSTGELGTILEGKTRTGHFDGVATVVTKLLLRVLPHVAIFGEKDYQQLCVIQRLVADLDIPVEIVGAATVREKDGLALSSRNAYLSPQERAIAPMIYEVLNHVGAAITHDQLPVAAALAQGTAALNKSGFRVDYLELRREDTLEPMERFEPPARLLAAAWLGATRLIDNIALE
ncbi:MAG: pantoate--beta-alanine ligase [Pseudomonadota bacterium]|nr:pantoate--beta-alanine ligase [Pseudomonadota bacterium]